MGFRVTPPRRAIFFPPCSGVRCPAFAARRPRRGGLCGGQGMWEKGEEGGRTCMACRCCARLSGGWREATAGARQPDDPSPSAILMWGVP